MLTQCPQCKTTYQLQVKQLKAAGGQVRCSRCHTVFDALENVVASTPETSSLGQRTRPAQRPVSTSVSQQRTTAEQDSRSKTGNRLDSPTRERITSTFGKPQPETATPATRGGDPLDDFINELESTTRHRVTPAKRQTPDNKAPKKRRGDQALLSAALESIDEIMARAMSHDDSPPTDADDENTRPSQAPMPPSPSLKDKTRREEGTDRAIDNAERYPLSHQPVETEGEIAAGLSLNDEDLTPEPLPLVEPGEEYGSTLALADEELTPELMPLDAPEEWFTTHHDRDIEDADIESLPLIEDEDVFVAAQESSEKEDDLEPLPLLEPEAASTHNDDDFGLEPLPLLEPDEEPDTASANSDDDFDLEPLPLLEPDEEPDTASAISDDDFDLEPLPLLEPEEEPDTTSAISDDDFGLEPLPLLETVEESVKAADLGHEAINIDAPPPLEPAQVQGGQMEVSEEENQVGSSAAIHAQAARHGEKKPAPPFQESSPVEPLTSAEPLLSDEESVGLFKGLAMPQATHKKVQKAVKKPRKERLSATDDHYRMVQGELLTPVAATPAEVPAAAKTTGDTKRKKAAPARATARQAPHQGESPPPGNAPISRPVEEEAAIPPSHELPPHEKAGQAMAESTIPPEQDVLDDSDHSLQGDSSATRHAANYAIPAELTTARRSGKHPLLWGFGIIMMCACLVLQYLYYFRMQLVANPQLRPLFSVMCEVTGCELPPRRDVSKIVVTERAMQFHPTYEESLLLTATLANTADFDQPYPLLEVIMTDIEQHTVARRHFLPQQYLNNYTEGDTFAAHSEVPLLLEVLDPGNSAVGFEFRFY